jgi:hypothetical protein
MPVFYMPDGKVVPEIFIGSCVFYFKLRAHRVHVNSAEGFGLKIKKIAIGLGGTPRSGIITIGIGKGHRDQAKITAARDLAAAAVDKHPRVGHGLMVLDVVYIAVKGKLFKQLPGTGGTTKAKGKDKKPYDGSGKKTTYI